MDNLPLLFLLTDELSIQGLLKQRNGEKKNYKNEKLFTKLQLHFSTLAVYRGKKWNSDWIRKQDIDTSLTHSLIHLNKWKIACLTYKYQRHFHCPTVTWKQLQQFLSFNCIKRQGRQREEGERTKKKKTKQKRNETEKRKKKGKRDKEEKLKHQLTRNRNELAAQGLSQRIECVITLSSSFLPVAINWLLQYDSIQVTGSTSISEKKERKKGKKRIRNKSRKEKRTWKEWTRKKRTCKSISSTDSRDTIG